MSCTTLLTAKHFMISLVGNKARWCGRVGFYIRVRNSDCLYNLVLRAHLTACTSQGRWPNVAVAESSPPPPQRSFYGPSYRRAQHGVPNATVSPSLLASSLSNTTSTTLMVSSLSTHSLALWGTLRSCQIHLVWMRADRVTLESPVVWPRFTHSFQTKMERREIS